jgi:hypothetical protein
MVFFERLVRVLCPTGASKFPILSIEPYKQTLSNFEAQHRLTGHRHGRHETLPLAQEPSAKTYDSQHLHICSTSRALITIETYAQLL